MDTSHKCDTCNLNQDSLQHIKDSLAHAFTWTDYTGKVGSESNLTGVWVFGPNDILVVANSLYHFDGTNFSLVPAMDGTHNVSLNGGLSGCSIFAFSPTDYWMVHVSEALHTVDGIYFGDYRFGPVNACWGTKSSDMFFVGNSGHIYHYDGTTFTQMNSGTTKDLRSVWGTSSSDVWAGGLNRSTGVSVLLHYNGSSWSEIDLSTLGQFGCAGCDGISSV